ncbi:MAG TPA: hypothetical protein VFG66_15105 [Gemmatimonadales bacterium]|nr:hypothetical protein [Gemmatimonadales bacterium]
MSRARFVCTDPDAGDFEFADVEEVLDALEAALVRPTTPVFDAARQSWQPVGMHPEIRAAWAERLRFRPPGSAGMGLPTLPSMTALARTLPDDEDERERRREAYERMRTGPVAVEVRTIPRDTGPRFAAVGLVWALVLLAVVGWLVVTLAAGLNDLAARVAGVGPAR